MAEQSLMFLTENDKERYQSWSKEQIFEAYLSEHYARVELNIEVNRLNRKIAEIGWLCKGRDNVTI